MRRVGIDTLPTRRVTKWMDLEIPYRPAPLSKPKSKFHMVQQMYLTSFDVDPVEDPTDVIDECYTTAGMLESKYDRAASSFLCG